MQCGITSLTLAGLLILFSSVQTAVADESAKIGVVLPLTGPAASVGIDIKNTLLFANQKLAGSRYQFIFEDDRCTSKDGVAAVHKLIAVEQVKYILGFGCSSVLLSAAPLLEKADIVAISSAASAPAVSAAGPHIYRTWPGDNQAAELLVKTIAKDHSLLGILSEETDYAQGFSAAFRRAAGRLKIVEESYATTETDVRPQLLQLKTKQTAALFINAQSEATFANVLRQARELGITSQVYGSYYPTSRRFLDLAGSLAEGIITVAAPEPLEAFTADGKRLLTEFVSQYGAMHSLEMIFGASFEMLRALDLAIESGENPRAFLDRAVFDGIIGRWSFDQNGDIIGFTPLIKQIRGGRIIPWAP